jgi:hypothetical protein
MNPPASTVDMQPVVALIEAATNLGNGGNGAAPSYRVLAAGVHGRKPSHPFNSADAAATSSA